MYVYDVNLTSIEHEEYDIDKNYIDQLKLMSVYIKGNENMFIYVGCLKKESKIITYFLNKP